MISVLLCYILSWLYHIFLLDSHDLIIHILQSYFTGTGTISASESTWKDMVKLAIKTNHNKTQQSMNCVHISLHVLYEMSLVSSKPGGGGGGGISQMLFEHINLNFHFSINYTLFNVWITYLVWNFKGYFEILHKIFYPCIEIYDFYTLWKL